MEIIRTEEEIQKGEEIRKILWQRSTKKEEEEFQKWTEEMEQETQKDSKNQQTE